MAIPDYEELMLPLLEAAAESDCLSDRDMAEKLAQRFGLSREERMVMLPTGLQTVFYSRVMWAKTYLKNAKLLEAGPRGRHRLSARGRSELEKKPAAINRQYLAKFPEFADFIKLNATPAADIEAGIAATPDERLEHAYAEIQRALAAELLEKIKACPAELFEKLIVDLLVKMGYGGAQHEAAASSARAHRALWMKISKTGEPGQPQGEIDGIINEDRLGLDKIYVQARRWNTPVPEEAARAFAQSLLAQRAKKGVLITTSVFSDGAKSFAESAEPHMVLIDGSSLSSLAIELDVGAAADTEYKISKIDAGYFGETAPE
ncbi:MAG: restriction endonuclease [Elusimicrobiales bacterium]